MSAARERPSAARRALRDEAKAATAATAADYPVVQVEDAEVQGTPRVVCLGQALHDCILHCQCEQGRPELVPLLDSALGRDGEMAEGRWVGAR